MKVNKLSIRINKFLQEVFQFTITPPNSTYWINDIIEEKTNEWPIKVGTIYRLKNKNGDCTEVSVVAFEDNDMVEWESKDKNYHCRYSFRSINNNATILEYLEWVDKGEIILVGTGAD